MYLARIVPTLENALFTELAKELIPAVAAKATRAISRTYSTTPWPSSSRFKRAKEFRIELTIANLQLRCTEVPNAIFRAERTREPAVTIQPPGSRVRLADVLGKDRSDLGECAVYGTSQRTHSRSRRESNQGD